MIINDMYDNDMRGNRVLYVLHTHYAIGSLMTLVANNNHDVQ
jgi:hypothetical protein